MHTMSGTSWESCKLKPTEPAIMESLSSMILNMEANSENLYPPDYKKYTEMNNTCTEGLNNNKNNNNKNVKKSFLLLDAQEKLMVSNAKEFLQKLHCVDQDAKVKVVSIFGNTGDGKSHTMNQTFFRGKEIFKTSNEQDCCTLGVWAAFDPELNVICLDTEGLQGVTNCENERMRLLLKVLAVSDIVIYRIQSERLNRDLFTFLGTASHAYCHHFKAALQAVGQEDSAMNSISSIVSSKLGPSIIVLHETRHTRPLTNNEPETAEDILKARFKQMKLEIAAFSSLKYVGLQTMNNVTDYKQLRSAIKAEVSNTVVRLARKPHLVYNALKMLNRKFSGETESSTNILFPNQYFTCPIKCLSCGNRCENSVGHIREGKPHNINARCRYQRQFENMVYICRKCYKNGNEVEVSKTEQDEESWYGLAVSAWTGYTIECPNCGEVYKSRQYWYGNRNPEEVAIRKKITHVWNTSSHAVASNNTAQRVIDGVSYITEAVANVSLQPTKALTAWVADQVAPAYWRPNHEIKHCHNCKASFGPADAKHHCRDCGEGFCAQCSSRTKSVPGRNWHTPVRVCDKCYDKETSHCSDDFAEATEDVSIRKMTEHIASTINVVGSVFNYPKALIKDSIRPSYWIPDSEIVHCCLCAKKFSEKLPLHHCRDCGRGVCQDCSPHRKPVPHRGWDSPVRVCDACV
ncbi:PREDICTED: zinc finger FYVE domain-containing protein 1-like [Dinoponera quadriceps]|uniref:Zinc finger FYVE domain-containing protein 1-like n=1 Tax=Dinoponera quadriceps TaxID=609295 RepID=A0A6P3XY32_DINQU|nr:PREDICTED: zinc finger FYVE domain-containing protein 1-like [Dinoponera quadriceps]